MDLKIRTQLSVMMFLQYFVWGAWYVTIGTYLTTALKFTSPQIGLTYGATAIAAILSPVIIGKIADRYFATEKVIAFLHLGGGILLFVLTTIDNFTLFYPAIILYSMAYMPTIALTNSLSFQQMEDPGKEFPGVRVLGTIGWIAVGLIIGFLKVEATAIPIMIASGSSILLGLYSFTLPHVPPKKGESKSTVKELLGLDALSLMKNRSFAILIISSLLVCIPLSFYYSFTNIFLNDIGMSNAAGKMTLGQGSEIIFLLVMPFFFKRFGIKWMILVGILSWALRFVLFAFGADPIVSWMLLTGIALHGICYDFFFVTGQIYVDNNAPKGVKSAAQGLITFATYGIGMLIGTWLSGIVVEIYSTSANGISDYGWKAIWLVPAGLSVIVMILFGTFFNEKPIKEVKDDASAEEYDSMAEPAKAGS